MIDLIGAPFDLCGKYFGSRMGPAALRFAGLGSVLQYLGHEVSDLGDLPMDPESTEPGGIRNFEPFLRFVEQLKAVTESSLSAGRTPFVLGGDHSMTVGAYSAALQRFGGDMALLWIDAHADFNTPGSSPSGNLHGMSIAASMALPSETGGKADEQWRRLLALLGEPCLKPENTAWIGLRDLDMAERANIRNRPNSLAITMHDIDRRGVIGELEGFDRWMRASGARNLWISFDVDALDPILAPGTGTAVRGGLTYREGHLIAELLHEFLEAEDCPYRMCGLDVVETNPTRDSNNETAVIAVEWIGSLLGKTILGSK